MPPLRIGLNNDSDDDFELIDSLIIDEEQNSHGTFKDLASLIHAQGALFKGPIFYVKPFSSDAKKPDLLWELFSSKLPPQGQQLMACRTCKRFIRQYGNLCVVDDDGNIIPVCWSLDMEKVPDYYQEAVKCVAKAAMKGMLGQEFILQMDQLDTLGIASTGNWPHMSMKVPNLQRARAIQSQESQSTGTTYCILSRILRDNSMEVINKAHHLIHDNQLPYATSHRAPLMFLKDVATKLENIKRDTNRQNLITRYSSEAFTGCLSALRSGMLAFLLKLVAAGNTFAEIKQKWESKADPIKYLRPTSLPSIGNIDSAERIFAQLGYTPRDLERVYLTLEQVPQQAIIWSPVLDLAPKDTETSPPPQKLFDCLLPGQRKSSSPDCSQAPIQDCTFRHFALKVLPTAKNISLLLEKRVRLYFFTSRKEGSKPIMSFHQENGHTASWYTWVESKPVYSAGLKPDWTPVKAIITFPHMFDHFNNASDIFDSEKTETFKFKQHNIRLLFCLEGAKEAIGSQPLCLFPSLLRGEFHSVRSTVEAFSQAKKIEEPNEGVIVGGLAITSAKCDPLNVAVVTKEGQASRYRITLFE